MKVKIAALALFVTAFSLFLPGQVPDREISKKEKIDALLQSASATYTKEPRKCLEYCTQILELTGEAGYQGERAGTYIFQGYALSLLGEREKALESSKKALEIYEKIPDKVGIGKAWSALGYHYLDMDYYNLALDYFLKSLEILKTSGKPGDLYRCYWNIGNLYVNLEDYPRALEYYQFALDRVKDNPGDIRVPGCLHNIGICHYRVGDLETALKYYRQALGLFEKAGQKFWTGATLTNLGRVYDSQGESGKALAYLQRGETILTGIGDKYEIFFTFYYTGDVYANIGNYVPARDYYDRAFKVAEEQGDPGNLEKIYKAYSDLAAARGDYIGAYEYFREYSKTRDFLSEQKKNRQLAELEVQFETREKTRALELLKKDNKIQKLTRNTFIAGFILVVITLALLFKKYLYLFAFWKREKHIGQYRIISRLGSGGMGTVYSAHTIRDKNQRFALKVLRDELGEDENSRQRFKQEGFIVDKVSHPNIVRVYERGEYKGKLYIAMEYLEGQSLARRIKEAGMMELGECLPIMVQTAGALSFIHEKNILHRDVKPENIMLVEEGSTRVVKVLDFGVALMKSQTRLTGSGFLVGTINYVAPEQITDNHYSSAGDVYAMGIVFYEMLVGRPAFAHEAVTVVVERILGQAPRPPRSLRRDVPRGLDTLILGMLAKDPRQRPTAKEVFTALAALHDDTRGLPGSRDNSPGQSMDELL